MKNTPAISLFLVALLSSCSHYYYVPNVQNVPLFREKNEYRISVNYGVGESVCTEVQAAYSVTDKIGVMTNFMSAKGIDNSEDSWGKGNYLDGAIGYYKPLSKSGVFEIYGGIGGSKQHHQYNSEFFDPYNPVPSNSNAGKSDLSFAKLFVQPSLGMTSNGFDLAFSTRLCWLYFNKIDNHIDKLLNEFEFYKLNSIVRNRNFLFVEPALTIRGGWKNVKLQLQGSTATYLNNHKWYFNDYHLSIGLYVTIAERYNIDAPD
jgi:hypothetical protein